MKILFAVSNENVSDAIVKSYQKNYNDTVTFKNVFYFNAIIKEIQRDRTYDRIIISEDLEPFANNNYDAIDKFIHERLSAIATEINDFSDTRIPIILICTDRRTKSSSMITKVFNIGIYDAVIGSDRKIDNVCKLISTPRTKEEAQQYYKLDDTESNKSLEDVSEEEVQNIVNYYKKLGKNEERYTDSFNNIAAQYTDAQLRIIIRYLPINVKAVLEAECAKYQEIVTYANNPESAREKKEKEKLREQKQKEQEEEEKRIREEQERKRHEEERMMAEREKAKKQEYVPNNSAKLEPEQQVVPEQPVKKQPVQPQIQKQKQPIGIDLLDKKMNTPGVQGNVLIPNAINTRRAKKVLSDEEMNLESNRSIKPETAVEVITEKVEPVSIQSLDIEPEVAEEPATLPGFEDLEAELEKIEVSSTKTIEEDTSVVTLHGMEEDKVEEMVEETTVEETVKRGRGRPRKNPVDETPKPKGKRGRPRKNPLPEENENSETAEVEEVQEQEVAKAPVTLPGFEDFEIADEEPKTEVTTLPGLDDEMSSDFNSFDAFEVPDGKIPQQDIYEEQKRKNIEKENINQAATTLPGLEEDEEFSDIELPDNINGNVKEENDSFDDFSSLNLNSGSFGDTTEEFSEVTLPGMNEEPEDIIEEEPEIEPIRSSTTLPGFEEEEEITSSAVATATSYRNNDSERTVGIQKLEEKRVYSTGSLENVLTSDKKIVAFVGTSKNGTSFIVNNLASLFSSIGVKTAILDMTQNRNAYYIYTNNDENLRQISYDAIEKLENGVAEGIKADRNLTVYTAVPGEEKDFSNAEAILTTLAKNESLVLIDCDFNTPLGYFANAQEIYLVQSMDILTIQPLTAFLRELKTKGILNEEKLRAVVNKEIRVRGLTSKTIIGGMSFYNDPSMSYMTELFNKDKIKACTLPFEDSTYSKYLETLVNCNVSINGYSKSFMNSLKILGNMVYPLLSKQTYVKSGPDYTKSNFSAEMNNTLNQMRNKY